MDIVKGIRGGIQGIKRMFGSQNGDAAEEANDVGSPTSQLQTAHKLSSETEGILQPPAHNADAMSTKLSHAASPPPLPATLPWASPDAFPHRTTASIDLTRGPYQDDNLPETSRKRLERLPRHSKRRNSEATPVPNPALGFRSGAHSMGKPGAGMGVQPINTLQDNSIAVGTNPAYGKGRTYGKLSRNTAKVPSREALFPGSEEYRQRQSNHHSTDLYMPSVKRRKTEKPSTAPASFVEITDDEDEVAHPCQASVPRACSVVSSGSPRSTISKHAGTGPRPASQPTSEFENTNKMLDPRRNKKPRPRRPGSKGPSEHRNELSADFPFLGAGSQPQEQPFTIHDDTLKSPETATALILQSHEQGLRQEPPRNKAQRSTGLTSNYFRPENPKMRINESTAKESTIEQYDRIAREQGGSNGLHKNLREHRHAEHVSKVEHDPVDSSEDELAQATPSPSRQRRRQSLSKARPKGTSQHTSEALGKSYPLRYARTYDSVVNSEGVQLRQTKTDPKLFRITTCDSEGNVKTHEIIDLNRINRSESDNINRIRLLGPATNGNRYWFDLQFANNLEFPGFRKTYVHPECLQNVVNTDKFMVDLFEKPPQWNDKIGKSPMISEEIHTGSAHDRPLAGFKPSILGALKDSAPDGKRATTSTLDRLRQSPKATQAPLRSVRSTRATAPIHNHKTHEEIEPERYSEIHGLGKPWAKPLNYSIDSGFLKRRKATIEFDDLGKLDEGQFLNDSIMTFYMLYLYQELKVSIDSVYFFNTYFYPTLTRKVKGRERINYDDVKSWTKRDDVFSYDYLVVPINENLHWYLGIICNVGKIGRKKEHGTSQEDSQDLDQEAASLHASDIPLISKNDTDVTGQSNTTAETTSPGNALDTEIVDNDDVNLFEEEKKLDLIDRDTPAADQNTQLIVEQDGPNRKHVEDKGNLAARLPLEATEISSILASSQAKQASKKKARNSSQLQKKDPEKPVIMILDSLGGKHSNATRALRQWLEAEGVDKRGIIAEIDNKGHYPKLSQIPMQTNFSDCGLYVLGYLRKFFANPDDFTTKLLQQQMSAQSDWPDMDPSKMRDDIRKLIFRLNDARNGARKEAHKAKQTANGKDAPVSPTNIGSKVMSPALKQPDASKTQSPATAPSVADPAPTPTATTVKASTPPTDTPRLGSPFGPEAQSERVFSPITGAVQTDDIACAPSTAQDLSSKTPGRPRQSSPQRTKGPEVRVPAKSPLIDLSTYEPYDGTSDRTQSPRQQPADLTSPLQNHGLRSKDNGKLHMPAAKKTQANSPARPSRERSTAFSPLQARMRSGSHDDPITLDDSQDLDAPIKKQSQSARKPQPEVIELNRSQESVQAPARLVKHQTQSSPTHHRGVRKQVANRDDSIRDVDRCDWEEDPDLMRALLKSLNDEGERLARLDNHRPYEPDDPMEDVVDVQAVYSQSSHASQEIPETQEAQPMEVDNDDEAIPESPEQRRNSPRPDIVMLD